MNSKTFWENFILVAIVLVIVQTFLDDLSMYMHWSVSARDVLLVSALAFDFIFSVEFTVRSILAKKKGSASRYWMFERGWVDFLSSIPLLLLNSGPAVIFLFLSGPDEGALSIGALNVLKVVKAIRVTRILRLIRIIKIFGKIHNAESPMAQHHTSVIATTSVFTMICVLMAFSLLTTTPHQMKIKEIESRYKSEIKNVQALREDTRKSYKYIINKLFKNDAGILKVICEDNAVLSNIDDKTFNQYYNIHDYVIIANSGISIYASLIEINKEDSYVNLVHFFIIITTVICFMIIYTRHFAQNISDVIHIMNQGFRMRSYNLLVKIREEFKEHEVFTLAKFYNDIYMPAKTRKLQKEEGKKTSNISMDFLKDFKSK